MSLGGSSNSDPVVPPTAPLIVVDAFLPASLALEMRRDIETHFAKPEEHRAETHQVWNYWFVPESYTYLRTAPEKVIERVRITPFHHALRALWLGVLASGQVTGPPLQV